MNVIEIRYNEGHGHMSVDLDQFLPTTQARLKKLMSVISLDYNHEPYLLHEIIDVCKDKIDIAAENAKRAASRAIDKRTEVSECSLHVKEKKAANGVPYTKDQLELERERLKALKETERQYTKEFNRCSKESEQLKKNLQQVQIYCKGRW